MNRSRTMLNQMHDASGTLDADFYQLGADSRDEFLELGDGRFAGLNESVHGDVLRCLGRIVAMSEDRYPAVNEAARGYVAAVAKQLQDPALVEDCPVCGEPALKTYECVNPDCGFSFILDYHCPHLSEDGARRCHKLGSPCTLFGLEYEYCTAYTGGR